MRAAQAEPKRIRDLAVPLTATDKMVASIADQLCAIVKDNYDIRIKVDSEAENLQVQKLTVLINSLLENVRRNIGSLSELANALEDKVRERTLKLDLIVQGSNDGVWLWDISSDKVEFSTRWRQLLGLEGEELSSIEDWLGRVHPEDQERLRAAVRAHLQGGRKYLREDYRIRHNDGTYRWMWCRGRCHRDSQGRPTFMAGTQTDVHTLRSIDATTGLPNEIALMATLDEFIGTGRAFRAMIIGVPRAVSMKEDMDSDELSSLRVAIARRLSATLSFEAMLAHLSGDYFAALIPGDNHTETIQRSIVEPLINAFEKPFSTNRRVTWLDVTCAATMPIESTGVTSSDVMRDAWTSYRCARKDNSHFNILAEHQIEAARDRAYMEHQVRLGLERGWFAPYFQPIVDIRTGATLGFETLCRMLHPELGIVSPGRFIPVAEDIGVMDQISQAMFHEALRQLELWSDKGAPYDSLFLTVNLEAHQVVKTELPDQVEAFFTRHQISPSLLKIEIVESSVIGNFEQAARQLGRLRDIGIKVALDDFGTGYSSLAYLNELPFDLIKIDKTFVFGMEHDARKRSMVKMMCVLAETLGAATCAEGIETQEQAAIARSFNVDFGQGFMYWRPMPQSELDMAIQSAPAVQTKAAS